MATLYSLVEGDGEVEALPILVRRILAQKNRYDLQVIRPFNAHNRNNLFKNGGLERFLKALAKKSPGGILVLFDAEQDCALELARDLAARTRNTGAHLPVAIVAAKYHYENWLIYDESIPDPKRWLKKQWGRYRETLDQPAFSATLDLAKAYRRCRSFKRLYHALEQLLTAIDNNKTLISP